jgi:hypothetical protein
MLAGLSLQTILGGLLLLALLFVVWNSMSAGTGMEPGTGASHTLESVDVGTPELDGILEAGVGAFHKVEHNNKFICTDCNNCMPAQYRNDVDLRFENLENVRRIRALRGDPFPTYQL